MNEKFYSLPIEKQERIINAGFRVFSQNSYKKSPMSEIADAAEISKSLLFHYFHNKKELYLFLWNKSAKVTIEALQRSGCYQQQDLFDSMYKGMKAKFKIMRQYPDIGMFVMKAYYEKDEEVCGDIQKSIEKIGNFKRNASLLNMEPEQFIPGLDIEMMYQDMFWATEGYLWEKMQQGDVDVDELERDFTRLLNFWKSIYCKSPGQKPHDSTRD